MGRYTWAGVEYVGDYEPLVSEETWQAVQDILDSSDKGQGVHHFWLLSGLLWSEPLGKLMVGAQIKGRFNYYRAAVTGQPEHNVRADEIEARVTDRLNCIRWNGDNPYRVPEEWRLALKVASNVGQLYRHLGQGPRRDLLRLVFLKKGIVIASGGAISKIDLYGGFTVDVR